MILSSLWKYVKTEKGKRKTERENWQRKLTQCFLKTSERIPVAEGVVVNFSCCRDTWCIIWAWIHSLGSFFHWMFQLHLSFSLTKEWSICFLSGLKPRQAQLAEDDDWSCLERVLWRCNFLEFFSTKNLIIYISDSIVYLFPCSFNPLQWLFVALRWWRWKRNDDSCL